MKKIISFLGLLFIATAVFAQSFTLKTADKTPCTVTLNGDFIVIEETLLGGYITRIQFQNQNSLPMVQKSLLMKAVNP